MTNDDRRALREASTRLAESTSAPGFQVAAEFRALIDTALLTARAVLGRDAPAAPAAEAPEAATGQGGARKDAK